MFARMVSRQAREAIRGPPMLGMDMRLVNVYLSAYFLLILGALVSLWYGGVLGHLSPGWVIGGLVAAVALGVTLVLTAARPKARD